MLEKSGQFSFTTADASELRERDWGTARDKHHVFWPRRAYERTPERQFRNHGAFVVPVLVEIHHELHAHVKPAPKPSMALMRAILNNIHDSITPINDTIDYLTERGRQDIADNLQEQAEYLYGVYHA